MLTRSVDHINRTWAEVCIVEGHAVQGAQRDGFYEEEATVCQSSCKLSVFRNVRTGWY